MRLSTKTVRTAGPEASGSPNSYNTRQGEAFRETRVRQMAANHHVVINTNLLHETRGGFANTLETSGFHEPSTNACIGRHSGLRVRRRDVHLDRRGQATPRAEPDRSTERQPDVDSRQSYETVLECVERRRNLSPSQVAAFCIVADHWPDRRADAEPKSSGRDDRATVRPRLTTPSIPGRAAPCRCLVGKTAQRYAGPLKRSERRGGSVLPVVTAFAILGVAVGVVIPGPSMARWANIPHQV